MYARLMGVLIALTLLDACGRQNGVQTPSVVRVGVVDAHRAPGETRVTWPSYAPLMDYAQAQSGVRHELHRVSDDAELANLFARRHVDITYLDAAHYVSLHQGHKAYALAIGEADVRTTAYFLVRRDEPARDLKAFKNRRLAFGPRYSAATHWMPRFYLRRQAIEAERFFQPVDYTADTRDAINRLLAGEADIVVATSRDFEAISSLQVELRKRLRILWETPPFASHVWATHSDFNHELSERFRWSLIELRSSLAEHRPILDASGGFQAAGEYLFEDLREVMAAQGSP